MTYYVPVLTYARDTWTTGSRKKGKLQASEMRFLRSTVEVSGINRIRNEIIREKLEPLVELIERSRLCWFVHERKVKGEDQLRDRRITGMIERVDRRA